ncbi:MAG: archaemetzincin family Zn-dependent metalloprotease [Aquificae bacterium]|nr:archaemetzincin family Zn-dependent metalloprotease [Aquificota bacterium]
MKPCAVYTFGVDGLTGTVLTETERVLREKFNLRLEYGGDLRPPLMGARDGQLLADALLYHLVKVKPPQAVAALGLTPHDLYSNGLNFVFGLASPLHGAAVVSYARLVDPDGDLFRSRVRKEVTHEMGHVFGLEHCPTPGCVMNFSNSLYEVDLKGEDFCPSCRKKLEKRLKELGIV